MNSVTFDSKGIIVSINIPGVSASCLQDAVRQLNAPMVCISGQCSDMAKAINDSAIVYENVYPILKGKEHKKYGWYRKFEKKRF